MSDLDLIIQGGTVVTPASVERMDIGVQDGKIVSLQPGLTRAAETVVDATGLHIFPGLIDSHVHFNEPGRADWEGLETGSRALAAGGGTLFFDMPLNAHPPTLDGASFVEKLAAAEAKALVDFAFWGGLTPGNLDRLEELNERGVVGFKAFMANSGIDDFAWVDDRTLREGMVRAAQWNRIVAVHAESEPITRDLMQQRMAQGTVGVRDYLESRPIHAELDAIARALELAGETGCALHIVHVSCGAGLVLVASAKERGVNVTCETCPHYLLLTEEDMVRLGAIAKCAPPLRPKPAQEGLWSYLENGRIDTVGSDHSPSPPELKAGENFFKIWGGISGIQHTLPILIEEGSKRRLPLPRLANLFSLNVARRFGLGTGKGHIGVGADADLALVNLGREFEVKADELFYRHRHSPYVGRRLTGKVVRTILRGQTVFKNGEIVSEPMGKLVKPES